MERGTINEHYVKVPRKGKKESVLRGPYYVISRREEGKTAGYHLTAQKLERARCDVESHKRFKELCREYEELTERLGRLEREASESSREKKLRRSRSKKMRR